MIVDKQGRMFDDRRKDNGDRRKKNVPTPVERRKDSRRKENNKIK